MGSVLRPQWYSSAILQHFLCSAAGLIVLICPRFVLGSSGWSQAIYIGQEHTRQHNLHISEATNYGTVGYTFEPSGSVVGVEVLTEVARLSRCVLVLDHHFLISIRQKSRAGPNA